MLTQEFHWAVGGLLEHAAALNAFLGPTVNCAKRYRKGTYAPASVTWGFENRSVAVRVKAGRGDHTHIENRLGSAASNPYLGFAGMLVAMLDGIRRQIEPPEPLETSAYQLDDLELLPATLEASLEAFEGDSVVKDAFHPEFVKAFLALKRHEVQKARAAVPGLRDRRVARRGDGLGARPVPVSRVSTPDRADVLIVGAGAAGGVVGRRLAEAGFRVICLEQGHWPDRADYPGPKLDWELQAQRQWSPDPNVRRNPADYPINVGRRPTSCR